MSANVRTDWHFTSGRIGRSGLLSVVKNAERPWRSKYANVDEGRLDLGGTEAQLDVAIGGSKKLGQANTAHRGEMLCRCWCETTEVWIPVADVGRTTRSCGRPNCKEAA